MILKKVVFLSSYADLSTRVTHAIDFETLPQKRNFSVVAYLRYAIFPKKCKRPREL